MNIAYELARILAIVAFYTYSLHSLASRGMAAEFVRYGVGPLRVPICIFQLLGASGLLLDYVLEGLAVPSAGGLSIMMLIALIVRIRIKDPWYRMLPAAFLFGLNLFLLLISSLRWGESSFAS